MDISKVFPTTSSMLLNGVALCRNPNGPEFIWAGMPKEERKFPNVFKVLAAEVGYICIVPFAIVETALNGIARLAAMCVPGLPPKIIAHLQTKLESSAFSIVWALFNTIFNPFMNDMIGFENVARAAMKSGNPFNVSQELVNQSMAALR